MNRHVLRTTCCVMLAAPRFLFAQQDPATQQGVRAGPPVRLVSTASAVSTESLGGIGQVRELPDGRLLVNDIWQRRLLLMDSTLSKVAVVLDSAAESGNTYGTRAGALFAARGDSSWFVDPASYTMLLLDPQANVVRVRAIPRMQDAGVFTNSDLGVPGVDANGRLIYRQRATPARPVVAPPRGVRWVPQEPDSAFIIAVDIDTRRVDTIGTIRLPKSQNRLVTRANGELSYSNLTNPLPLTDDWAVTSDGVVAFVRGRDYRIEYRTADGEWSSGPKLPYGWRRLLDVDKQRVHDSVETIQRRNAERNYAGELIRWVNRYGKKEYPKDYVAPEGLTLPNGYPSDWALPPGVEWPARYIFACAAGEEPTVVAAGNANSSPATDARAVRADTAGPREGGRIARGAMGGAGTGGRGFPPGGAGGGVQGAGARPQGGRQQPGAGDDLMIQRQFGGMPSCIPSPVIPRGGETPAAPTIRMQGVIDIKDFPDYEPPLASGSVVRADLAGNLWIRPVLRPAPPPGAGAILDVVNRAGEMIDRIQLPPSYGLVGFGRNRVVYLQMRDAKGIHLARVQLASVSDGR